MKQGHRHTEELLVFSSRPQANIDTINWRPYASGNTIGEILTAHNLRCRGSLEEKTPALFAECLEDITPILTVAAPNWDWPGDDRFSSVKVILLDLDTINDQEEMLGAAKEYLTRQEAIIYLVQVSRTGRARGWTDFFDGAQVVTTGSEIYRRQSELEAFLHKLRETHGNAWRGVTTNPFTTTCAGSAYAEPYIHPRHGHFMNPQSKAGRSIRRVYQDYRLALPETIRQARDTAMARRLLEKPTFNLGLATAVQEFLLALIVEQVRIHSRYPVSVEFIQRSLSEIPVDTPLELGQLQKVRLVALHMTRSRNQPSAAQCDALTELGFDGPALAVVQFDRPKLWETLATLRDFVTTKSFTAELPGWYKPALTKVGLTETSFGVRIEESFFIKSDDSYQE